MSRIEEIISSFDKLSIDEMREVNTAIEKKWLRKREAEINKRGI